jgi:hypothetical protein
MDEKIMSRVDEWMKISDTVVDKKIVIDKYNPSSEMLKFFAKYPDFSPLNTERTSFESIKKPLPYACNNARGEFMMTDLPPNNYYIGIHDMDSGCAKYLHRQHSQTLSLFAFVFEKMSVLEKQVERQQKTLDFILEKILEDECDSMFTPVVEAVEIPCVASYMFNSEVD